MYMLLLRDSIDVLGLGVVAGDAAANAVDGGSLFSFRGVAGGSAACGCSRWRCGGRRLGSGVDSLGLAAASDDDDGTPVRGRASFAFAAGWPGLLPLGVTGMDGFTFITKFPGFCCGLT